MEDPKIGKPKMPELTAIKIKCGVSFGAAKSNKKLKIESNQSDLNKKYAGSEGGNELILEKYDADSHWEYLQADLMDFVERDECSRALFEWSIRAAIRYSSSEKTQRTMIRRIALQYAIGHIRASKELLHALAVYSSYRKLDDQAPSTREQNQLAQLVKDFKRAGSDESKEMLLEIVCNALIRLDKSEGTAPSARLLKNLDAVKGNISSRFKQAVTLLVLLNALESKLKKTGAIKNVKPKTSGASSYASFLKSTLPQLLKPELNLHGQIVLIDQILDQAPDEVIDLPKDVLNDRDDLLILFAVRMLHRVQPVDAVIQFFYRHDRPVPDYMRKMIFFLPGMLAGADETLIFEQGGSKPIGVPTGNLIWAELQGPLEVGKFTTFEISFLTEFMRHFNRLIIFEILHKEVRVLDFLSELILVIFENCNDDLKAHKFAKLLDSVLEEGVPRVQFENKEKSKVEIILALYSGVNGCFGKRVDKYEKPGREKYVSDYSRYRNVYLLILLLLQRLNELDQPLTIELFGRFEDPYLGKDKGIARYLIALIKEFGLKFPGLDVANLGVMGAPASLSKSV